MFVLYEGTHADACNLCVCMFFGLVRVSGLPVRVLSMNNSGSI